VFEKELEGKLKKIFGLEKVTYESPGESSEQGCLFIDIDSCKNTIKDGKAVAMVSGSATIFGPGPKIPFGFFAKAIRNAPVELTKDLFFFDIENNTQRIRDIVQRGFSFIYFFRGQYDPAIGTITSVTIAIEES
jgi:hypothetical protein